jgi:Fe-S cluster biosynthesis and repair protein YggX
MLLINHYGLNVRDPRAREFLVTNLRSFLFAEGDDQAEIDTSKEGNVNW